MGKKVRCEMCLVKEDFMEEVVGIVFDFVRSGLIMRGEDGHRCE